MAKKNLIYRGSDGVNNDVGQETGDASLVDGRILSVSDSLAESLLSSDDRYALAPSSKGGDEAKKED